MAEGEQEVYVRSARTKVGAPGRAEVRKAGCGPGRPPRLERVCVSIRVGTHMVALM